MAQMRSVMLPLGTKAPSFKLPDAAGNIHTLEDFSGGGGVLIIFMCNHCPFVKLYFDYFAQLEEICNINNIKIIAINSNDFIKYPDDSPEKMISEQARIGFNFTYLVDESGEIAKSYEAKCTPDSYLFDKNMELFYRGQLDDSRPSNNKKPTLFDISEAIKCLAQSKQPPKNQIPSIGCGIKWKI